MNLDSFQKEAARLKTMGITLISLAVTVSGIVYLLPNDQTNYWLSRDGKEGFYVLSALFGFLGCYCLGAIWRKRNFL